MARGEYVITLDSDDYFAKNLLSEMIKIFERNPGINFAYSDYYETSKDGKNKIFRVKNIFQTLACATMYRKRDLAEEGFWKKIKFPEYEILLATIGMWEGCHIKKPLYYFNRHVESLSGKMEWVREALKELKKIHPDKLTEIKKIRKFK
jgi:glycosyltransferase involved in cell wall biosynthesis